MSGTASGKTALGLAALRRSGVFLPIEFPSWTRTTDDLVGAIAKSAGVVGLVGNLGSGRTLLLASPRVAGSGAATASRGLGPIASQRPALTVVDDVDRAALARLAAAAPGSGTQVLAIPPELLAALVASFPDAGVVRMRPMASPDVRMMIDARREQAGQPAEAISARAVLRLEELCAGNPRQLDRLLGRAVLVAQSSGAEQLRVEHVNAAIGRLPRETVGASKPDPGLRLGPARRPPVPSGTRDKPGRRLPRAAVASWERGQAGGRRRLILLSALAAAAVALMPANHLAPTVAPPKVAGGPRVDEPSQRLSMLGPAPQTHDGGSVAVQDPPPTQRSAEAPAVQSPEPPPAALAKTDRSERDPPGMAKPVDLPDPTVFVRVRPRSVGQDAAPAVPPSDAPPTLIVRVPLREMAELAPAAAPVSSPVPEAATMAPAAVAPPPAAPVTEQLSAETSPTPLLPPGPPMADPAPEQVAPIVVAVPASPVAPELPIGENGPALSPRLAFAEPLAGLTAPDPALSAPSEPPAAIVPAPSTSIATAVPPGQVEQALAPQRAGSPAEGARLLALGRTLASIGQLADARAMLRVSARMGNIEALGLLAVLDTAPLRPGPARTRPVPVSGSRPEACREPPCVERR